MSLVNRIQRATNSLNTTIDYNWRLWAHMENRYTPDIQFLQQYRFQFLFVCDEMMQGRPQFEMQLGVRAARVCSAFTQEDFTMWKWPAGDKTEIIPMTRSFTPDGVKSRDSTPPWANFRPGLPFRILGQLYIIRPVHFLALDTHKQNGVQFYRRRSPLLIPNRLVTTTARDGTVVSPEQFDLIHAWMYLGKHDFYSELLDSGYHGYEPMTTHQSKRSQIGRFYYFTPMEIDAR